jgi:hypothetical protein
MYPAVFDAEGNLTYYNRLSNNEVFDTYLNGLSGPGYDPEEVVNRLNVEHKKLYNLEFWGRTGLKMSLHKILRGYEPGVWDFNLWPMAKMPNYNIGRYLDARGIHLLEKDKSRTILLQHIRYVQENSAKYTIRQGEVVSCGGYSAMALVSPTEPLNWSTADDGQLEAFIRDPKFPILTESWLLQNFGIRNSSRYRSFNLLRSGQILFSTIKVARKVKMKNNKVLDIVTCDVVASQKQQQYTLYLFYEKPNDKNELVWVDHPYSVCSCLAGHYFDSHMLGVTLVLHIIKATQCSFSELRKILPDEHILIDSVPICFHFMFGRDFEYSNDNYEKAVGAKITGTGKKRKVDKSSSGASGTIVGHLDDLLGEIEIAASDMLGRAFQIRADEDRELEELIGVEKDTVADEIISKVGVWFNGLSSKIRKRAESKIKLDLINDGTKEMFIARRPNYSPKSKTQQLEMHERFWEAFRNSELPLNPFYYFLDHHRSERMSILSQLKDKRYEEFNAMKYPASLDCVPCERGVLGDRAFYQDSMKYANVNPQSTPQFKPSDGEQFSRQTRSIDSKMCSLRWTVEQKNAFTTNSCYLQDVIPFTHFGQLQYALDFQLGTSQFYVGGHPVTAFEGAYNGKYYKDIKP